MLNLATYKIVPFNIYIHTYIHTYIYIYIYIYVYNQYLMSTCKILIFNINVYMQNTNI